MAVIWKLLKEQNQLKSKACSCKSDRTLESSTKNQHIDSLSSLQNETKNMPALSGKEYKASEQQSNSLEKNIVTTKTVRSKTPGMLSQTADSQENTFNASTQTTLRKASKGRGAKTSGQNKDTEDNVTVIEIDDEDEVEKEEVNENEYVSAKSTRITLSETTCTENNDTALDVNKTENDISGKKNVTLCTAEDEEENSYFDMDCDEINESGNEDDKIEEEVTEKNVNVSEEKEAGGLEDDLDVTVISDDEDDGVSSQSKFKKRGIKKETNSVDYLNHSGQGESKEAKNTKSDKNKVKENKNKVKRNNSVDNSEKKMYADASEVIDLVDLDESELSVTPVEQTAVSESDKSMDEVIGVTPVVSVMDNMVVETRDSLSPVTSVSMHVGSKDQRETLAAVDLGLTPSISIDLVDKDNAELLVQDEQPDIATADAVCLDEDTEQVHSVFSDPTNSLENADIGVGSAKKRRLLDHDKKWHSEPKYTRDQDKYLARPGGIEANSVGAHTSRYLQAEDLNDEKIVTTGKYMSVSQFVSGPSQTCEEQVVLEDVETQEDNGETDFENVFATYICSRADFPNKETEVLDEDLGKKVKKSRKGRTAVKSQNKGAGHSGKKSGGGVSKPGEKGKTSLKTSNSKSKSQTAKKGSKIGFYSKKASALQATKNRQNTSAKTKAQKGSKSRIASSTRNQKKRK